MHFGFNQHYSTWGLADVNCLTSSHSLPWILQRGQLYSKGAITLVWPWKKQTRQYWIWWRSSLYFGFGSKLWKEGQEYCVSRRDIMNKHMRMTQQGVLVMWAGPFLCVSWQREDMETLASSTNMIVRLTNGNNISCVHESWGIRINLTQDVTSKKKKRRGLGSSMIIFYLYKSIHQLIFKKKKKNKMTQ